MLVCVCNTMQVFQNNIILAINGIKGVGYNIRCKYFITIFSYLVQIWKYFLPS